jgi:hypothetical protein
VSADRICQFFSNYLQNQENFARTVEILMKHANFYVYAFGFVLRRFLRKVFLFSADLGF